MIVQWSSHVHVSSSYPSPCYSASPPMPFHGLRWLGTAPARNCRGSNIICGRRNATSCHAGHGAGYPSETCYGGVPCRATRSCSCGIWLLGSLGVWVWSSDGFAHTVASSFSHISYPGKTWEYGTHAGLGWRGVEKREVGMCGRRFCLITGNFLFLFHPQPCGAWSSRQSSRRMLRSQKLPKATGSWISIPWHLQCVCAMQRSFSGPGHSHGSGQGRGTGAASARRKGADHLPLLFTQLQLAATNCTIEYNSKHEIDKIIRWHLSQLKNAVVVDDLVRSACGRGCSCSSGEYHTCGGSASRLVLPVLYQIAVLILKTDMTANAGQSQYLKGS
ncbi:hypothetical protein F5Y15DRAFT_373477 [Xylariaceae sp. FL0016]|nr:hypothetical protein F5Y15DRAFT_373477 [Xylariaceae sp. FL0016]